MPPSFASPDDRREFAEEIQASKDLLSRATRRGTMKNAQQQPTPAPPPVTAQDTGNENLMPPAPPPGPTGQAAPPAPPAAPPAPVVAAPAADPMAMDDFIEEKKEGQNAPMSGADMGIEPTPGNVPAAAKYAHLYSHLRIRHNAGALEVFDPGSAKREAILTVKLNARTCGDAAKVRQAAIAVLANVAHNGLGRTAEKVRGRLVTADGIVDYGMQTMDAPQPKNDKGVTEGAVSDKKDEPAAPPTTATGKPGEDMKDGHPDKKAPGLGAASGGVQDNGLNSAADAPKPPGSSSMDATKDGITDKKDEPGKPADTILEDAVDVFANESLTAGLRRTANLDNLGDAKAEPFTKEDGGKGNGKSDKEGKEGGKTAQPYGFEDWSDVPRPGEDDRGNACAACGQNHTDEEVAAGECVSCGAPITKETVVQGQAAPMDLGQIEARYKKFYEVQAAKYAREAVQNFARKFVRCARLAAYRSGLNLDGSTTKAAMADALMSEGRISNAFDYLPMDATTARFCIERGLTAKVLAETVDDYISRAASFMRVSEETLAQMEDDVAQMSPAEPPVAMPGEEDMMAAVDEFAPMPQQGQEEEEELVDENGNTYFVDESGTKIYLDPATGEWSDVAPGKPGMHPQTKLEMGIEGQEAPPPAAGAPPPAPPPVTARAAALAGNLTGPGAAAPSARPAGGGGKYDRLRGALNGTRTAAIAAGFGRG